MASATIEQGYVAGAIGRIVELHARYYHEAWGFGRLFEAQVAAGMGEFMGRYDDARDGLWTVSADARLEGSIAIDGQDARGAGAHLRWFIVSPALHGAGVGARLVDTALAFCRARHYQRVYLWTFEGLVAARHLYEGRGFRLAEQRRGTQWGTAVNEQRFVLEHAP